jgi:aspartate-semialdehyde dehydrogenase
LADKRTVALIGSESLLGREVRDIVATSDVGISLRLIASDSEQAGTLTRVGDEPSLVEALGIESLAGARAIFLAGSAESNRKAVEAADADSDAILIDLTYATEDRPDARVRAPLVESADEDDDVEIPEAAVHVIAHPAAIALALLLRRLHRNDPVRRSVIQILAPASEYGTAAVEELQQQTVSLLSFKSMPRTIFDAQLSFNLLAKYGEEARMALEETELRIERHLATLLALPGAGEGAPMPSLRLIQAPVFHGYSFSVWVEFEGNPGIDALESTLGTASIEIRGREFEPPTNVGQTGQGGIAVGGITEDRNEAEACWFWMVADNLRIVAENAVAVAQQLV